MRPPKGGQCHVRNEPRKGGEKKEERKRNAESCPEYERRFSMVIRELEEAAVKWRNMAADWHT